MQNPNLKKHFVMWGYLEAISFLVLVGMMILKYKYQQPLGVKIVGPIHGFFYMFFAAYALNLRSYLKWDLKTTGTVLAAGSIPFCGFFIGHKPGLLDDPA